MQAYDKFKLNTTALEIKSIKPGAFIPITDVFFEAKRSLFRGLEEHLAEQISENWKECHDFTKPYVYSATSVDGTIMTFKFHDDKLTVGGKFIYCA